MKKFRGILISFLLLLGGLFLFNPQPVHAANTVRQANKMVKKYHLKKATVPKNFHGHWYRSQKKGKKIRTEMLTITSKHIYSRKADKKTPIYKLTKPVFNKVTAANFPINDHITLISWDKTKKVLSVVNPGYRTDDFHLSHKFGNKALYTSSFDEHPYYKTKKLAAKYVNK